LVDNRVRDYVGRRSIDVLQNTIWDDISVKHSNIEQKYFRVKGYPLGILVDNRIRDYVGRRSIDVLQNTIGDDI
jgi:hypothetical protein